MGLNFEWDARKAASNRRKHGVDFEEASTAFGDPLSIIPDPGHSQHGIASFSSGSPFAAGSWLSSTPSETILSA